MLLNMLDFVVFNNPLRNYLWLLFFIILGFFVSFVLVFISKNIFIRLTKITKNKVDDVIAKILSKPLPFKIVIVTIFFNIGFKFLEVSQSFTTAIKNISFLVYVLAVTLFVIKFFIGMIDEYLIPHTKKTESKYDDQLIPLLKSLIKVISFILAILVVLSNFGYNISALLAGLGIGGLAVALASKDVLENFLSGIVIFVEKPFHVGDTLKTSDGLGTIEEIGIRSTKIRTFDNTLVIVPNRNLSLNAVENITARRARRENFTIGLEYSTSVKKMEVAKNIVSKILNSNENVEHETIIIGFESFGEFSLNIRIIYWIRAMDYASFINIKDNINLSIKREFEKEKISFAFPTKTIHLKK